MADTPIRDSWQKKDYSITMDQANWYALPILVVGSLVLVAPFVAIWGWEVFKEGVSQFFTWRFLPVLIVGILAHELIHGLSWMIAGRKPFSAIRYGFQIKTFTPYAHCKEPLPAGAYKIGAAMPGLLLGLVPSIIAIAIGNGWWLCFGVFFTVSAAGDAIILWLIRNVPGKSQVEDHPERAGCYVYERNGNSE